jgi:hypothetical protein
LRAPPHPPVRPRPCPRLGRKVAATVGEDGGGGCSSRIRRRLLLAPVGFVFPGREGGRRGVSQKSQSLQRVRAGGPTCKMRNDRRSLNGRSVIHLRICAPDTLPNKSPPPRPARLYKPALTPRPPTPASKNHRIEIEISQRERGEREIEIRRLRSRHLHHHHRQWLAR